MTDFQPAYDRIDRFVEQQMAYDRIPGLALAITDRKQVLRVSTYGYANLESKEPVTPQHLFEIGSIGKSFTAVAVLQLHEEGKLDLHAPVTEYLPWFEVQTNYEPITSHHLLTHTAGLIAGAAISTDKFYDVWALRKTETAWPPGSRYHNSDVGYKILGLVLEYIEGASYADIIHTRILDPLNMTQTEPIITHEIRHRLVTGYTYFYDDRPWLPHHGYVPATWLETDTGDGSIASTSGDLATYLQALMNRGRGLLSEDLFDLLTMKVIEFEPDRWFGYGLHLDEIDDHAIISHGGDMPGYWSYMHGDLDAGFGVAILINGIGRIFNTILFTLQSLSAVVNNEPLPEVPMLVDRRTIENAEDYVGSYEQSAVKEGRTFDLVAEDQRLYMSYKGARIPLWKIETDTFVADHPDFCLFSLRFSEADDVEHTITHGGNQYRNNTRYRERAIIDTIAHQPIDQRGTVTGHYRSHHPLLTNFRVVEDWEGNFLFVDPSGDEQILRQINASTWRVEDSPETIRFDVFVDGQALRANFSGGDYYRFFTE